MELNPTVPQDAFIFSEAKWPALVAGFGCLRGSTRVVTSRGLVCISDLAPQDEVLSWDANNHRYVLSPTSGGFPKGKANLLRIVTEQGEFVASEHHRVLLQNGNYQLAGNLNVGQALHSFSEWQDQTISALDRIWSPSDDRHYWQILADYLDGCVAEYRLCDQPLRQLVDTCLEISQQQACVHTSQQKISFVSSLRLDGQGEPQQGHNRQDRSFFRRCMMGFYRHSLPLVAALADYASALCPERILLTIQQWRLFPSKCEPRQKVQQSVQCESDSLCLDNAPFVSSAAETVIVSIDRIDVKEDYWDCHVAGTNNYITEDGTVHHNSGKTEALLARCLMYKIKYPDNDLAFYEPTYDLIRMIAWPRFESMLSQLGIPYTLTKHPTNVLEIDGAGKIYFRSMDTPSRIIGYEVADSFIDELDTLKTADAAYCWRQIVARNRQKKPDKSANTIAVATTPEGFRFVYQQWEAEPVDGCELIRASTYSNPHLPGDYVDNLRALYPSHLLDAYIDGRFVNLTSGTVYLGYNRISCSTNITEDSRDTLLIGVDFNVGNMSAVVHVKRDGKPIAVGEITKGYDTPDMCRLIRERYPKHQVIVYPDASGGSRKSVNASVTDIQILKDAGFSVFAHSTNPAVKDRINAMNAAFKNGYLVNADRCPNYVRCLEQQAYNNNGEPDKTQGLDHLPDAGGYMISYEYPIIRAAMSLKGLRGL